MAADKKEKKAEKKAATPDDIMSAAEMKPILALAKGGDPASCAFALTASKEGVILLDKHGKPKKLVAELKKKAAAAGLDLDVASLRFGRAVVDPENKPGLLTFIVNKDASGAMRPRLLDQVKKAGYKAVEIITDPGIELEPEDDAPLPATPPAGVDMQAAPAAELAASGQTPGGDTEPAASVASTTTASAPAGTTDADPGAAQEVALLAKELTDVVREMVAVVARHASAKAELLDLAKVAQTSTKRGDPRQLRTDITALRDALKRAEAAGDDDASAAGPDPATAQKLKKTRAVWDATVAKLTRDLEQLVKTVTSAAAGHELGDSFEREFATVVKPLVTTVDTSLSDLLHRAAEARGAREHQEMMEEARLTVKELTKFVETHPVIDHLDDNPFHPVAVGKTLTASLAAVARSLN